MPERAGLPPVVDSNSRVLVLGSLPGEKSIQAGQYYRHGTNRFWKVVYEAFGAVYDKNFSYSEKLGFLKAHGIALWDMYHFAYREGSADSTISLPRFNDFTTFFASYPSIKCVLFNGKKLSDLYNLSYSPEMMHIKEIFKEHGITPISLASTSGMTPNFDQLYKAEWLKALRENGIMTAEVSPWPALTLESASEPAAHYVKPSGVIRIPLYDEPKPVPRVEEPKLATDAGGFSATGAPLYSPARSETTGVRASAAGVPRCSAPSPLSGVRSNPSGEATSVAKTAGDTARVSVPCETPDGGQPVTNVREDEEPTAEPQAASGGFDFGSANESQKKAIASPDGPVLITAGPGTGKTYTLVQRTIYLVQERGVKPENILVATFTNKAAKELVTRISNELIRRRIPSDVKQMYVGTFHSICARILEDNLEYTRLKRNFRILDKFDQQYMIFINISKFRDIVDLEEVLSCGGAWRQSEALARYFDILTEEMVSPEELAGDADDARIAALGELMRRYYNLLEENNMIDFPSLQRETYELFSKHSEILAKYREQLTHIMVDEYQDTNYIQERLVFMLAGERQNICVVGDDDQGLYRFRGATIRNILEFPQKFPAGLCKIIPLTTNYRSNAQIVDFYNKWMESPERTPGGFSWSQYRYRKTIVPHKPGIPSPAVVRISAQNNEDAWRENILRFINALRNSGKLKDLNQIAFLFRSVKFADVQELSDYLEENGVPVYSPRSDMFFNRDEVRLIIGCLILLFPNYFNNLAEHKYEYLYKEDYYTLYLDCAAYAITEMNDPRNADLKNWIRQTANYHKNLGKAADYSYSGLLYRMFGFSPFNDILDTDTSSDVKDQRPMRNLSKFTQIVEQFEYLYNIQVLTPQRIENTTEIFFNLYLRLLYDGGIREFESEEEYAPSGCVSMMTIHQAKGLEFPIVIVGSLGTYVKGKHDQLLQSIEEKYFKRPAFEPKNLIRYFDYWRAYYTAFSRAQNLLVLTCNESGRAPNKFFRPLYYPLPEAGGPGFHLEDFSFEPVKDVNLKDVYSFTSHIMLYETCPRQYKFYKELEFTPVKTNAMLFGTVVHETLEDIHKAALRNEQESITKENITAWFNDNYETLSKAKRSYLAPAQKDAALNQVLNYAARQRGSWDSIKDAELEVNLVKPDYILEGKIDLIRSCGDGVEIVDFKSEPKPTATDESLTRYHNQLNIYAHLVEEQTGRKVEKMSLYYTGESAEPTITFANDKTQVDQSIAAFDATVRRINCRDFSGMAKNKKTCYNCDFRYYCGVERKPDVQNAAYARSGITDMKPTAKNAAVQQVSTSVSTPKPQVEKRPQPEAKSSAHSTMRDTPAQQPVQQKQAQQQKPRQEIEQKGFFRKLLDKIFS